MSQLQAVRKKQMRTKSYSSNQNTFDEKRSDKAEKQIKAMSALAEMRQEITPVWSNL